MNNIIKLVEPKWGEDLLVFLNDYVNKSYLLSKYVPLTADMFVFSYPIYLSWLYLYWIYKKNVDYKNAALYVFFSWFWAVTLNLFIQFFVDKQRPEQLVISANNLIFSHVPDNPFPSDHAAMSAAIATSVLLRWLKNNNKSFVNFSIVFWIFSILMSFSRIAAWVHWPTDIIFWTLVWILVPYILIKSKILNFLTTKIFSKIIILEKKLMKLFFWINQ